MTMDDGPRTGDGMEDRGQRTTDDERRTANNIQWTIDD